MTILATIIGYIVILLLAIAFCAFAVMSMLGFIERRVEAYVGERITAYVKDIGSQMINNEYWFHDIRQRAMWLSIAEPLSRGSSPDPSKVRDVDFNSIVNRLTK